MEENHGSRNGRSPRRSQDFGAMRRRLAAGADGISPTRGNVGFGRSGRGSPRTAPECPRQSGLRGALAFANAVMWKAACAGS